VAGGRGEPDRVAGQVPAADGDVQCGVQGAPGVGGRARAGLRQIEDVAVEVFDVFRCQVRQPDAADAAAGDVFQVGAVGGDRVGSQARGHPPGQPGLQPAGQRGVLIHRWRAVVALLFQLRDLAGHLGLGGAAHVLAPPLPGDRVGAEADPALPAVAVGAAVDRGAAVRGLAHRDRPMRSVGAGPVATTWLPRRHFTVFNMINPRAH
jgi:hypothetical protein